MQNNSVFLLILRNNVEKRRIFDHWLFQTQTIVEVKNHIELSWNVSNNVLQQKYISVYRKWRHRTIKIDELLNTAFISIYLSTTATALVTLSLAARSSILQPKRIPKWQSHLKFSMVLSLNGIFSHEVIPVLFLSFS